ncbi:MAG: tetratricopeptide repeat protein [Treponema sp.]|jgi:tetratricopeptide (TPR) repeat protein|nr:tetratricopeptide repeat protein [Treponema sp.]
MRFDKKPLVSALFIFLNLFTFISGLCGDETYNYYALEYFKKSLECLVTGEYNKAINYCNQVIIRDPKSAVTYTIRARAYFEKNDMNNAIKDCTQAINLDKSNISAYFIRGNAYAKEGNLNKAISDWQSVLRLDPENENAKYNIELAQKS